MGPGQEQVPSNVSSEECCAGRMPSGPSRSHYRVTTLTSPIRLATLTGGNATLDDPTAPAAAHTAYMQLTAEVRGEECAAQQ